MKKPKKKLAALSAVVALLALSQGCATVEWSSPDALDGVTVKGAQGAASNHMVIYSETYFLLWSIPLCSGDLRWDPERKTIRGGTRFFSDMAGVDELQSVITNYAESRDCNIVDINYNDVTASYAGVSYSGIIGALFGASRICASATLVPRNQEGDAECKE